MERAIDFFVKSEIYHGKPLPSRSSRRFYPESRDIRNHMYRSATKYRHSKIDQENLSYKIKDWESSLDDKFFFRRYTKNNATSIKEQLFFNENGDFIGEVFTSYLRTIKFRFVMQ